MRSKYISKILVLILTIITLICSYCGPQKSKKQILHEKMVQDSTAAIFQNFTTDSLSSSTIKAFESRAIQKISDLRDYFSILSDTSLDATFKQQAKVMALKLFISNKCTLPNPFSTGKDEIKILSLLDSLKLGHEPNFRLIANRVEIAEHAQKIERVYKGSLIFNLRFVGNDVCFQDETSVQCSFSIKKTRKSFGSETKFIWEVFLGSIEIKK